MPMLWRYSGRPVSDLHGMRWVGPQPLRHPPVGPSSVQRLRAELGLRLQPPPHAAHDRARRRRLRPPHGLDGHRRGPGPRSRRHWRRGRDRPAGHWHGRRSRVRVSGPPRPRRTGFLDFGRGPEYCTTSAASCSGRVRHLGRGQRGRSVPRDRGVGERAEEPHGGHALHEARDGAAQGGEPPAAFISLGGASC